MDWARDPPRSASRNPTPPAFCRLLGGWADSTIRDASWYERISVARLDWAWRPTVGPYLTELTCRAWNSLIGGSRRTGAAPPPSNCTGNAAVQFDGEFGRLLAQYACHSTKNFDFHALHVDLTPSMLGLPSQIRGHSQSRRATLRRSYQEASLMVLSAIPRVVGRTRVA